MHNTFAEAVEDCLICVMSRTDLERLILNKPQVALRLAGNHRQTATRGRRTAGEYGVQRHSGAPGQFAIALGRRTSQQRNNGLTHQDLAESVGTYRETATQVLNDLKAGGYIDIGRKRITILNREGLETVAES